jgi:hypothetical protein
MKAICGSPGMIQGDGMAGSAALPKELPLTMMKIEDNRMKGYATVRCLRT